ncbi:hypothetical protein [Roseovarius mucosus]|uniref:hypothetical protein n=1 Tax=Roseovarius mucosus TaxID=215743 RepID=UPI0035D0D916
MDLSVRPNEGSVIHYSFLWSNEHEAGITEGKKDRPSIVILTSDNGKFLVAPITHRGAVEMTGLEIPTKLKRQLGLDEDKSWVVASDLNRFTWPGFDLRKVPGADKDTCIYGSVPPEFLSQIRSLLASLLKKNLVATIDRDEGPS